MIKLVLALLLIGAPVLIGLQTYNDSFGAQLSGSISPVKRLCSLETYSLFRKPLFDVLRTRYQPVNPLRLKAYLHDARM